MAASSSIVRKNLKDVLYTYCSPEIIKRYTELNDKSKAKMLDALQTVLDNEILRKMGDPNAAKESLLASMFGNIASDDPLLSLAMRNLGVPFSFNNFREIKHTLSNWGKQKPRMQRMMEHYDFTRESNKTNNRIKLLQQTNSTVTKCELTNTLDFSILEKTFIRNLKLFEIAKGKFIEGTILTPPNVMVGINTFLEDEHGDYIQLDLYNMIPNCEEKSRLAELKFPVGQKIKISQPFYKIFVDGNPGIRVDSPEDILSITEEDRELEFDEIREQGKILVQSGDIVAALGVYINGLSKFKEIFVILNNRAQAGIKLGQFEEALLDSAAVLFMDERNSKARQRYILAAKQLGYGQSDTNIINLWKSVLSYEVMPKADIVKGSKEEGNNAFKKGEYKRAKQIYTGALMGSDIGILLSNIGIVSLKCQIYQTAISAASACLQIVVDPELQKKARYTMTKSFSKLGELKLVELSAKKDSSLLEAFFIGRGNPQQFAEEILTNVFHSNKTSLNALKEVQSTEIFMDFIQKDSIEHCYIPGKGRGLIAKKDIRVNEILLIDHPIVFIRSGDQKSITGTINSSTRTMDFSARIDLKRILVSIVKYDGLLAKKLLLLDTSVAVNSESVLPLVDLEWMAYHNLSKNLMPFLPQTPFEVGVDRSTLTQTFIEKAIDINVFEWGLGDDILDKGVGLALRVSLFNHDYQANCIHVPIGGDAMVLFASRNIQQGEELTIQYCNESEKMKKWGL